MFTLLHTFRWFHQPYNGPVCENKFAVIHKALTHWGLNTMVAVLKTTFNSVFFQKVCRINNAFGGSIWVCRMPRNHALPYNQMSRHITATEMPFWRFFCHWLYRKLFRKLLVQPVAQIQNDLFAYLSQLSLQTLFSAKTWRVDRDHDDALMTSSNGNIFHVAGFCAGEFTSDRWIPPTKASDTELWRFLSSEPTVEQTMETPVIWDATALIMASL